MKTFFIQLNSLAVVLATTLCNTTSVFAQSIPPKTLTQVSPQPVLRRCPDPAARQIDFQLIQRTNQFNGRVRITGVVRNVGRAAYESNPGQQIAYLYENERLVAQRSFQNLTPGQEVRVVYVRDWNISSPAEGEFPPTYKLIIGYDPDIAIDGNPRNDDCNLNNNRRERSGEDIRALFR